MKREDILNEAMCAADETEIAPGVRVRKMSLATLAMLSRAGSRMANPAALADGAAKNLDFSDIAEFIFIHAAAPDLVRRLLYRAPREEFAEAADAFCARVPAEKIPEIVAAITGDAAAVRAAQAEAIPDANLPASKNAPGPAAS